MDPILGIDLGTTNSLVAVMDTGGPRLIPNALGEVLTPSIVAFSADGQVVVGQAAREIMALDPQACAALFKRDMGLPKRRTLGGRAFSPQELSALVLRSLAEDAARDLGRPVTQAVITVPAYFNDAQRQATRDAGELAGLEVVRMLNEPTAAALAYGLHGTLDPKKILIFDLGGGTFDVSLLQSEDGIIEVLASAGEAFLGGEDFTRRLMGEVLGRQHQSLPEWESRYPEPLARLRYHAESAKVALSERDSVDLVIPDPRGDGRVLATERISAAEFGDLVAPLVARFGPVTWQALRDAKVSPADVDEVLLVGGASRMAVVGEFVRTLFGREANRTVDPDTVVALGAAVQAGLVAGHAGVGDLVATDVMPHTLGVEVVKEFGSGYEPGYFMPVIERNTTIPTSRVRSLSTVSDNQKHLLLKVFQGESRHVRNNLALGELSVTGVPKGPAGSQEIEVRFTYDLSGLLEVEATVVSTQATHRLLLETRPGRLTDAERAQAKKNLAAIRIDPRGSGPYGLLLAKGRRLYSELVGASREQLESVLDRLEAALVTGDPAALQAAAADLEFFLSWHGGEPDRTESA